MTKSIWTPHFNLVDIKKWTQLIHLYGIPTTKHKTITPTLHIYFSPGLYTKVYKLSVNSGREVEQEC